MITHSTSSRQASVVNFLGQDPQATLAWSQGSDGEQRFARHLQGALADRVVLLHDRTVPRTLGTIEHLAVAESGIWVIDANNSSGSVERRDVGPWLSVDHRLYVGGRNLTRLVDELGWQVGAVESALGDLDLPVHGALCFTDASWQLFRRPFKIRDVWVIWADALTRALAAPGPLSDGDVIQTALGLAETLRPAFSAVP